MKIKVMRTDPYGIIIEKYSSIKEASRKTGIPWSKIKEACREGIPAGGFMWDYWPNSGYSKFVDENGNLYW